MKLSGKPLITHGRVLASTAFVVAFALSLTMLRPAHLCAYRQTALVSSAFRGNVRTMKLLLAAGADVNEFGCPAERCRTPLVAAAEANELEAVQLLLVRGADINKKLRRGQTALLLASYHGDTDMVKLLLSRGADPNADCDGDTALGWAKQKGHMEIVNLLVAAGARR